jgi:hypothetical protein
MGAGASSGAAYTPEGAQEPTPEGAQEEAERQWDAPIATSPSAAPTVAGARFDGGEHVDARLVAEVSSLLAKTSAEVRFHTAINLHEPVSEPRPSGGCKATSPRAIRDRASSLSSLREDI